MSKTVEDFRKELISVISTKDNRDREKEKAIIQAYKRADEETKKIEMQLRDLVSGLGFGIRNGVTPQFSAVVLHIQDQTAHDLIIITPQVKLHNSGICDFAGYTINTSKGKAQSNVSEYNVLFEVTNFLKEIILNKP